MTANVLDYFALLGQVPREETDGLGCGLAAESGYADLWNNAITDIAVVCEGESVEDDWELIDKSVGGLAIDYPLIAIRRRSKSKRLDHICKIHFIGLADSVPVGFEKIHYCCFGTHPASLGALGYMVVKRAPMTMATYAAGAQLIDSFILVLPDEEEMPAGYSEVMPFTANVYTDITTSNAFMACREVSAIGIADTSMPSTVLDRYPAQDRKDVPLPAAELPTFVFPFGLRYKFSLNKRFPLPTFFTFVFTDAKGGHMYAACLRFYEMVPETVSKQLLNNRFGLAEDGASELTFFCPKVICLLSSNPFYRAMRRYLKQLYSMSLSHLPCPLEYFITSLVSRVPVPVPGGRPFHFILDSSLISSSSRSMPPVVFDTPSHYFFPPLDLDFSAPLRCLSVENLLVVFILMLREAKLVFLCCSNNMLTETMECLRALLFPLKWATTFISRLPESLTGLFQALGGFMIGFSELDDSCCDNESINETRELSTSSTAAKLHSEDQVWMESLSRGTYVIDLSTNRLFLFDGQSPVFMTSVAKSAIINSVPYGPRTRIWNRLHAVCLQYSIGPQRSGLQQFDSAFDFQSPVEDVDEPVARWDKFPTLEVRDAFMTLLAELLGHYERFIIPPSVSLPKDTFRTFKEEFRVDDYISSSDQSVRPLLEKLVETQTFEYMMQRRLEGNDFSISFFEQCLHLLQDNRLSSLSILAPKGSSTPNFDLPAPLYKLLHAKHVMAAENALAVMKKRFTTDELAAASPSQPSPVKAAPARTPPRGSITSLNAPHQDLTAAGLKDILAALKVVEFEEAKRSFSEEDFTTRPSAEQRLELDSADSNHSLCLFEKSRGPIIVPGPRHFVSASGAGGGSEESVRFVYSEGWPQLKPEYLFDENAVNMRVREIQKERVLAVEKIKRDSLKLLRNELERQPFLTLAQPAEFQDDVRTRGVEQQLVLNGLVDLAAVSILMLGVRVLCDVKPVGDILQMLGILSHLEDRDLAYLLDESIWRTVLVSCANAGGPLMRQISWVIYDCMNNYGRGKDSLTYGQFVRATGTAKVTSSEDSCGSLVDPFLHLEETGHTWFIQRRALKEHISTSTPDIAPQHVEAKSTTPAKEKSSMFSSVSPTNWSMFKSAPPPSKTNITPVPSPAPQSSTARKLEARSTGASSLVAMQLRLSKPYPCSFFAPEQWQAFIASRHISVLDETLSAESFLSDSRSRIDKLQLDAAKSIAVVKAGARGSIVANGGESTDMLAKMSAILIQSGHNIAFSNSKQIAENADSSSRNSLAEEQQGRKSTFEPGNSPSRQSIFSMGASMFSRSAVASSSPLRPQTTMGAITLAASMLTGTPPSPRARPISRKNSKRIFEEKTGLSNDFSDSEEDNDCSESEASTDGNRTQSTREDIEMEDISSDTEVAGEESGDESSTVSEETAAVTAGASSAGETAAAATAADANSQGPGPSESSEFDSVPKVTVDTGVAETAHNTMDEAGATASSSSSSSSSSIRVPAVSDMQRLAQECLQSDSAKRNHALGIFSRTECACGYAMLDDEIMSAMLYHQQSTSAETAPASTSQSQQHRHSVSLDLSKNHDVLFCPYCKVEFEPQLHVRLFRKLSSSDDSSRNELEQDPRSSHEEVWSVDVSYLSPCRLRISLEELVERIGERVVDSMWLYTCRPDVFWSLVWFCTRTNLPTGLLASSPKSLEEVLSSDSFKRNASRGFAPLSPEVLCSAVLVGWSPLSVTARIARYFDGRSVSELDLDEVFHCSQAPNLECLKRSIAHLDGSIAGMRKSILEYSTFSMLERSHPRTLNARNIYTGLLSLAHYSRNALILSNGDQVNESSGMSRFDKLFLDAIRCAMAMKDFIAMETTDTELMSNISGKFTNTVRSGFGFLL